MDHPPPPPATFHHQIVVQSETDMNLFTLSLLKFKRRLELFDFHIKMSFFMPNYFKKLRVYRNLVFQVASRKYANFPTQLNA